MNAVPAMGSGVRISACSALRAGKPHCPKSVPQKDLSPQEARSFRLSVIPSTKGSPSHLVFYSSATTPPSLLKLLPLSSGPSPILLQNPTYKYFSPVHWKLKGAASKQSYFHYFCGKPNCFLLKQST